MLFAFLDEAVRDPNVELDVFAYDLNEPDSATTLGRFWQMLAHAHGQLWNASKIAASLGVSPPTVRHYLDILQDSLLLRQLQPFHANLRKRYVKSQKVYRELGDRADHRRRTQELEAVVLPDGGGCRD